MKYHIQPNTDGTYTVLETSDQDYGTIYVVDRTIAEQIYNFAQMEQLQLVMYDAQGNSEYIFLKLRNRLFQRNNSYIFAFLTIFLFFESVSVGGRMIFEGALMFGMLYFQYYRMIELKKRLYNQKYTFPLQGQQVRLRQNSSLETTKKFKKAMFAEGISLFVMWLTVTIALYLNNNQALIESGRHYGRRNSVIDGPVFHIANGLVWEILVVLFSIATILFIVSIWWLRCKGYAEREFTNQYYTLKARLENGTFLGWEYDEKLTRAEGYIIQWSKRRNSRYNMKENMKTIQKIYDKHW